jgi:hypothetical protein
MTVNQMKYNILSIITYYQLQYQSNMIASLTVSNKTSPMNPIKQFWMNGCNCLKPVRMNETNEIIQYNKSKFNPIG